MNTIAIEVVGYKDSECSPFPCDENRTCELSSCNPSNKLIPATEALRTRLQEEFPTDNISIHLILLDEGVPDFVREIYEAEHPAIPMILINRKLFPIGRISWPQIRDAIRQTLTE